MNKEFEFAVGDKVLAYDNGLLYEAKCLKRGMTMVSTQYFLHFIGFNSRFDEWFDEHDVLEINKINLDHKERLFNNLKHSKKSKKVKISNQSNTTNDASPKSLLRKTDNASNIIPNITPHSKLLADKLRNIAVPHNLQKALFLDFVMNNTFQKLLKFPEKHFLSEILFAFTQSTYFEDDSEMKSSKMLCIILMQYFNSDVNTHLLYINEKRFRIYDKAIQHFEQRTKNQSNITYIFKKNLNPKKIWCYVYGPLYLLRFLAHLPFILMSNSSHPECDLDTFVLHIKGLYQFLENNYDTYFTDNDYMDVE